eukprot:1927682-Pyramimonas_sp.AAC.1
MGVVCEPRAPARRDRWLVLDLLLRDAVGLANEMKWGVGVADGVGGALGAHLLRVARRDGGPPELELGLFARGDRAGRER